MSINHRRSSEVIVARYPQAREILLHCHHCCAIWDGIVTPRGRLLPDARVKHRPHGPTHASCGGTLKVVA